MILLILAPTPGIPSVVAGEFHLSDAVVKAVHRGETVRIELGGYEQPPGEPATFRICRINLTNLKEEK